MIKYKINIRINKNNKVTPKKERKKIWKTGKSNLKRKIQKSTKSDDSENVKNEKIKNGKTLIFKYFKKNDVEKCNKLDGRN